MINLNDAFIEELYFNFLRDKNSVSPEWRNYFETEHKSDSESDNSPKTGTKLKSSSDEEFRVNIDELSARKDEYTLMPGEDTEIMGSISMRISDNMEESLRVPTATSVRMIPVKALDENRRVINKYLTKLKRQKVSFTHILLWAIVRALVKYPNMNNAFARINGKPAKIRRKNINVGLAVDVLKKDGSRLLLVPNVKNAQTLNFSEFIEAFDRIIDKSRNNKLDVDDLVGTSVTLTNPGMIGTTFSSPRLMKGQGLILAAGSIDYPTEFQAMRPEILTSLAVSKVVTITSTYDHRIIQGAESAEFLAYIHRLLIGEELFYDQIFVSLKIPFEPVRWAKDSTVTSRFGIYDQRETIEKGAHVMQMINAYRVRGHLLASVNPLGMISYYYPELDPAYYGFTIWDLDRIFHADDSWEKNNLPLRDIIELLRETYCGAVSFEFMHMQAPERKEWVKSYLERTRNKIEFTIDEKKHIYQKLVDAEIFESFLHTKFVGHKRFSLEGSEALISLVDKVFEDASEAGLNTVMLGMAHRGRLNVLVNNIGKDPSQIFAEFEEDFDPESYHGSGDVKYHLGDWGIYASPKGKTLPVVLAPNPSHLELVDPVIEGMARAKDNEIGDESHSQVLPILIHGDAAFAGQGIVAETLNMSQLEGYRTGGTIHIIVNNQIGFTTSSVDSRSSYYATDVSKMIQAPIIHVNGNDPEAVVFAASFAIQYRNKFNGDIIIDMLSYRKYGHNEADEPTYTQPLLYKKIKVLSPVREMYEQELIKEKVLSPEKANEYKEETKKRLNSIFSARKKKESKQKGNGKYLTGKIFENVNTKVSKNTLFKIADAITRVPETFQANPKVLSLLQKRKEMMHSEVPAIDWAMAEALALGSLLIEGKQIRFSGQDSRRGTFSQRHAVLTDTRTEVEFTPLNNIELGQSKLRIYDSPLSEMAVLGYEYGYSVISNNSLTLWEAQFGDFANGAQPIFDQFIAAAEAKWGQVSNLVVLLPHGYDGQGPEHSSARLERYLQLCAQENMIVGYFTTPAQYFHALRRQVLMPYKKPMILMTPKSMLRNTLAVSGVDDLINGKFMEIIPDEDIKSKDSVEKLLLCSGKVYYDLLTYRNAQNLNDFPIVRIEQLYPLNIKMLVSIFNQYPNLKEIRWVQEEPENMGAWRFLFSTLFSEISAGRKFVFAGRGEAASTASGSYKIHNEEQVRLVSNAFA